MLGATQGICAKKKPPQHPVKLNTAAAAELQQVPGIGPAIADEILQARKSYGRFKSVNDLQALRGSGTRNLDKIQTYLSAGTPPQPMHANTQAAAPAKNPAAKPSSVVKTPPPANSKEEP
ncbi:MAG: helix-hairpin-helix domain-containing protein [Candidatus Acidiferrum sp.]